MPIQSAEIQSFEYTPSLHKEYDYQSPVNTCDLLNENIARIESLKAKILENSTLTPKERDTFFRELDILRGAFIDFANKPIQTARTVSPLGAFDNDFPDKSDLKIEGIIGQTPRINKILETISKVAPTNLTILLEGETGTGKELFARIIHLNDKRNKFVAVNCGAFPSGVIESELFGHVKGAFTGAISDRKGKFEEADPGTIFLDEIGELELSAQVKLLRVLETGELQRVGSDQTAQVNVRIIAATNRNLEEMVEKGSFREDLFYRINMCPLHLPPLRERRDEIEILFEHFLQEVCSKNNKPVPKLHKQLRKFIHNTYDFPGNIRELKNMAQFLGCVSGSKTLELDILPEHYLVKKGILESKNNEIAPVVPLKRPSVKKEAEKKFLVQILKKHHGNIKKICSELEVSRSRVYQLLMNYELKIETFR